MNNIELYDSWLNLISTECKDSPNLSELVNYVSKLKQLEEETV